MFQEIILKLTDVVCKYYTPDPPPSFPRNIMPTLKLDGRVIYTKPPGRHDHLVAAMKSVALL
jgi:hypothetical protein